MGVLRGLGRAAPLVAAGVAAGWYLKRQGLLGPPAHPELAMPRSAQPIEAHVESVEAVSDAADVPSVVEDLLAAEPDVVDAEVVEEGPHDVEDESPDYLDERVREALGDIPAQVESYRGVVWLRGELDGPTRIAEAERLAEAVSGVTEVRNLLHLPGTPPPPG